ncbi:lactose-binding lectin l-2-like [Menidia menidia]
MMLVLFLAAAALSAVSSSDEQELQLQRGGCPMFWYSFNGRCYKYVASHLTWGKAELYCLSEGANLVSIHSQEESNFVKSLIKNFDPNEGYTWIGLSDLHYDGKWMWSDGSKAGYFIWSTGEPTNWQGMEHCVHTNYGPDRNWNDNRCYNQYPAVCATRAGCP